VSLLKIPSRFLVNFEVNQQNKCADQTSRGFVDGNKSVYIFGTPGSGKTHLAYLSYAESLDKLKKSKFVKVPEIMSAEHEPGESKDHFIGRIAYQLCKTDLLYLDELIPERHSDELLGVIYQVLDFAFEKGRPRIFMTCNFGLDMVTKLSDRIASRIAGICGSDNVVENNDEDWRLKGG